MKHNTNKSNRRIPITVFGVTYPSIRATALAFGVHPSTFRRNIISFRTEPEVALLGDDANLRLLFVGLDNKAYNFVPWSEDPVTTRKIVEHYRPDLLEAYDKDHPTGEYSPFVYNND